MRCPWCGTKLEEELADPRVPDAYELRCPECGAEGFFLFDETDYQLVLKRPPQDDDD